MWKDRILSALLAVAVSAAAGAAVWRFAPEKALFSPTQLANGVVYEAVGVAAGETVASVDGNAADAETYTFWLGQECANLARYGIDVSSSWDTAVDETHTMKDYVVEDTLTAIKQQLVLENLCARYGVTLTAEDEAELADRRAAFVEQYGGEDGYRAELYRLGVSEAGYDRLSRTDYLYRRLYELYTTPGSALYADDDVLRAYAAGAGWITADHILLMTIDQQTREPLDEATVAEKRAQAEDILRQLRDGADPIALFGELADQYSEDGGRASNPEGYTFTYGTMVDEFDDAARALDEGEYSDIVESPYGYHIILRRPLNVAEAVEGVRGEYFDAFFLGELERAQMETTDALEKLDPAALYEALRAAQAKERTTADTAAPGADVTP